MPLSEIEIDIRDSLRCYFNPEQTYEFDYDRTTALICDATVNRSSKNMIDALSDVAHLLKRICALSDPDDTDLRDRATDLLAKIASSALDFELSEASDELADAF